MGQLPLTCADQGDLPRWISVVAWLTDIAALVLIVWALRVWELFA
ncbi:hypothetical protein [Roseococcus pinisoli]|nr:hypothetical protein [Roseococcus pinisoli]